MSYKTHLSTLILTLNFEIRSVIININISSQSLWHFHWRLVIFDVVIKINKFSIRWCRYTILTQFSLQTHITPKDYICLIDHQIFSLVIISGKYGASIFLLFPPCKTLKTWFFNFFKLTFFYTQKKDINLFFWYLPAQNVSFFSLCTVVQKNYELSHLEIRHFTFHFESY